MNFYKRYPGDYLRDTGHLSLEAHGAYTLLLDRYYSVGSLPPDMDDIYALCHADTKARRVAVQKVMAEFFPDGKNHRADEEIAKWNEKATHNRTVGKLGGRPRSNPNGNPEETQTVTQTVTQTLTQKKPSQKPEVREEVREDSEVDKSTSGESPSGDPPPSIDQAIYADARKVFGRSIGGQIGKAIRDHGKPWILGIIEACRDKDPEQARAYLGAALKGGRPNGVALP